MQIQLKFTRPIRGLQSFGLEKPLWSTQDVEEIQWDNGFEVRVAVPKLVPQDIIVLDNTPILSVELCKENLEQIKAWTSGEGAEKMWDFVSANDKVAFDGEYAIAFPTPTPAPTPALRPAPPSPAVPKLTKAQIAAQAKADAEREAAEAAAAQAAADTAAAEAEAESSLE